jgi:hypothetical protein
MSRWIVVVSLALAGGCFTELPALPGTGSEATTTTTGTGTTGSGSTTTSPTSSGTTTTGPVATTDADPQTTGGSTSTGPEPPADEGLFQCAPPKMCMPWECLDTCTEPGPEGTCVLKALAERVAGTLEVVHCDKECAQYRVLVRGSGTEQVRWQSRTLADPPAYSEVRDCVLQPPQFFADCQSVFAPECEDPTAWVKDCQPVAAGCF